METGHDGCCYGMLDTRGKPAPRPWTENRELALTGVLDFLVKLGSLELNGLMWRLYGSVRHLRLPPDPLAERDSPILARSLKHKGSQHSQSCRSFLSTVSNVSTVGCTLEGAVVVLVEGDGHGDRGSRPKSTT